MCIKIGYGIIKLCLKKKKKKKNTTRLDFIRKSRMQILVYFQGNF